MIKLFKWTSDGEWFHPWEHTHHTHLGTQSHQVHICREGISACLCFEARAACITKSHSQRAFTPHVWEAPGIGRECAHSVIYTNTICMPDAIFYHRSKLTRLGTWNLVAACLLLLVKRCFNNCSYLLYKPMGRKVLLWNCCTAQLLFKYCIIQIFPHFPSSCSSKKHIWQQRLSRWRPI